jgi:hypothetical protein
MGREPQIGGRDAIILFVEPKHPLIKYNEAERVMDWSVLIWQLILEDAHS